MHTKKATIFVLEHQNEAGFFAEAASYSVDSLKSYAETKYLVPEWHDLTGSEDELLLEGLLLIHI